MTGWNAQRKEGLYASKTRRDELTMIFVGSERRQVVMLVEGVSGQPVSRRK